MPPESPFEVVGLLGALTPSSLWLLWSFMLVPVAAAVWAWKRWAADGYERSRSYLAGFLVASLLLTKGFVLPGVLVLIPEKLTEDPSSWWASTVIVSLGLLFACAARQTSHPWLRPISWIGGIAGVAPAFLRNPSVDPRYLEFAIVFGVPNALFLFIALRSPTSKVLGALFLLGSAAVAIQCVLWGLEQPGWMLAFPAASIALSFLAFPAAQHHRWRTVLALVLAMGFLGATLLNLEIDNWAKIRRSHLQLRFDSVRQSPEVRGFLKATESH
jgi:hypothetical protein